MRARAQADLDLDRRVAAAVEDLAGVDALDLTHRGTTVTGATGRRLFGGSRRRRRRGGAGARLRDSGARRARCACCARLRALYCLQSITTNSARQSVFAVHVFLNSFTNLASAALWRWRSAAA